MTLLNTNKKPGPKQNTCNTIYKIPCKDCDDYYIGQTCRPLIKRVKEHEASCRLKNYIDSIGNIKSAPAKYSHDNQHTIDWSNTTILTVAQSRQQLNLLEHAAITCYNPQMNRQHKGPRISQLWSRLNYTTQNYRQLQTYSSQPTAMTNFRHYISFLLSLLTLMIEVHVSGYLISVSFSIRFGLF